MAAFRKSSGHIPIRFAQLLQSDPGLAHRAIQLLLEKHFEPSLHADILSAVGLDTLLATGEQVEQAAPGAGGDIQLAERAPGYAAARAARGSTFRAEVLAAYDHRCAVSGFQAMLAGTAFCLEAAHVHWHSQGGPSTVDNGLALTPTLHKLFDHGAWTLDDKRRVLVSRHFSGSDSAITELRALHGRALRTPVPGSPPIALDFIRWHREQSLGGVFRGPAIAG
jgi:putative restriction endonuclease